MDDPIQNFNSTPNIIPKPASPKKPLPWIIVGIVLLVIVLGSLGYYYFQPKSNEPNQPESNLKQLAVSDVFVKQADNGQLLEEFPKGLIVDKNAVILASAESVTVSTTTRTFVTSYKTKLTSQELEKSYLAYIKANGFNVISDQGKGHDYLSLLAVSKDFTKPLASFTVSSFKSTGGQTIVMITFNTKK